MGTIKLVFQPHEALRFTRNNLHKFRCWEAIYCNRGKRSRGLCCRGLMERKTHTDTALLVTWDNQELRSSWEVKFQEEYYRMFLELANIENRVRNVMTSIVLSLSIIKYETSGLIGFWWIEYLLRIWEGSWYRIAVDIMQEARESLILKENWTRCQGLCSRALPLGQEIREVCKYCNYGYIW